MIFNFKAVIYKREIREKVFKAGTWQNVEVKGRCSHCSKVIKPNVMIMTQTFNNRWGGGVHKYCPACSEAGMKELKEATKNIKFRAKIGWDNY